MPHVNLFLLLPESEPSYQWMIANSDFIEEEKINWFVKKLADSMKAIELENYIGFFDAENIRNFSAVFDELKELYPAPPLRLFRSILKEWENWREEPVPSDEKDYCVFGQSIEDHTICEIAERLNGETENNHALFNHHALSIQDDIEVISQKAISVTIPNLTDRSRLIRWFAENRLPQRNFQVTLKHGENRQDVRTVNNETISPLRCSVQDAQDLLKTAIGETKKELFNYDFNYNEFIVFKFRRITLGEV